MRVYTSPVLRNLISCGKLCLGLALLVVVLSQAVRIWGDDPALQEIRNLLQTEQSDQL